jgi:hypothetical protein
MNFSSAIQAHTNWKLRLYSCCSESSQQDVIDVASLAKDNVCELGKWLHGDGQQNAADPRLGELISMHAAFHRAASSIAAMIANGKQAEVLALLDSPESEYAKLSLKVVGLLMDFRKRHGNT